MHWTRDEKPDAKVIWNDGLQMFCALRVSILYGTLCHDLLLWVTISSQTYHILNEIQSAKYNKKSHHISNEMQSTKHNNNHITFKIRCNQPNITTITSHIKIKVNVITLWLKYTQIFKACIRNITLVLSM